MQDIETDSGDLSAGNASQEDTFLAHVLLSEQQQKKTFRDKSFYWAWLFSSLFFISVLTFSWAIMFCPNVFLLTKEIHPVEQGTTPKLPDTKNNATIDNRSDQRGSLFNQFLIMLALLSAVGTTLAIAVMRFSFSDEKQFTQDSSVSPISPIANSMAEFLNQIVDLMKKR